MELDSSEPMATISDDETSSMTLESSKSEIITVGEWPSPANEYQRLTPAMETLYRINTVLHRGKSILIDIAVPTVDPVPFVTVLSQARGLQYRVWVSSSCVSVRVWNEDPTEVEDATVYIRIVDGSDAISWSAPKSCG